MDIQSLSALINNINEEISSTTSPLIEALYRHVEMGMLNQKE